MPATQFSKKDRIMNEKSSYRVLRDISDARKEHKKQDKERRREQKQNEAGANKPPKSQEDLDRNRQDRLRKKANERLNKFLNSIIRQITKWHLWYDKPWHIMT